MMAKYDRFLSQGSPVTKRYRKVQYNNFKKGAGLGAAAILAALLAGELTGANAASAEEIQQDIEGFSRLPEDQKFVKAALISDGLARLTGFQYPTAILSSFFNENGDIK